jgi:hypothetical protein
VRRPVSDGAAPAGPRSAPPPDARSCFERLAEVVDAAARRRPCAESRASYRFAGLAVGARMVGAEAARWLDGPFGPPVEIGGAADVEIDVAEGRAEGSAAGFAEGFAEGFAGGVPGVAGPIVSDARYVALTLPGLAAALDREAGRIVAMIDGLDLLPHWERAKPLATLLSVWCQDRGVRVVHAGLVARSGEGLLFVGPSGSGKSTASLACAADGFDFLGDDCVGLRPRSDGGFDGLRLYATATLERDHLERSVLVGVRATGPVDERNKAIVAPGDRGRLARSARVRAVVMPRLAGRERTGYRRASAREALLALAPSSIVRRAAPGPTLLRDLARLVGEVPCYWLEMSLAPGEIPACADSILREAEPL